MLGREKLFMAYLSGTHGGGDLLVNPNRAGAD